MRTNGNPDSTAILAAMAVFPECAGPSNKTLINGVLSDVRTAQGERSHLYIESKILALFDD